MSQRYFSKSCCIEQHTIAINRLPQKRVPDRCVGQQVDGTMKKTHERVLQREVVSRISLHGQVLELHQNIDIAARRVEIIANSGTKDRQLPHVISLADCRDLFWIGLEMRIHQSHAKYSGSLANTKALPRQGLSRNTTSLFKPPPSRSLLPQPRSRQT